MGVQEIRTRIKALVDVEYTKGPWTVGDSTGRNACNIYALGDETIASVYGVSLHRRIDEVPNNLGFANAQILAAAPQAVEDREYLLQLLTELVLAISEYRLNPNSKESTEFLDYLLALTRV